MQTGVTRSAFPARTGILVLLTLLSARVLGMVVIPLMDTTEARYGEIARKMAETGDWITMYQNAQPFMAKPPLFAWLSSAAIHFLGATAFAPRLPNLLLSAAMVWMVWSAAARYSGRYSGLTAALALAGTPFFLATAGTVMTDTSLTFSVTLVLLSFWNALHGEQGTHRRVWGYLFFVGCGVGLLAKGPVALVLAGLPILIWTVVRKTWVPLWRGLPWVTGIVVTSAIALPWYLLMEKHNPGFLQYFIVGENISRFLDSSWQGDRYGFAHAYPYGSIWGFAALGLFPWPLLLLRHYLAARRRGTTTAAATEDNGWRLFLLLWCLCPLVFFSFAANIIWPYVLPMIPGFALFFADAEHRWGVHVGGPHYASALLTGAFALAAVGIYVAVPEKVGHTDRSIVAAWRSDDPSVNSRLLIWRLPHDFSAEYYAQGRAREAGDAEDVSKLLLNDTRDYIICESRGCDSLPAAVKGRFEEAARIPAKHGPKLLLREKTAARAGSNGPAGKQRASNEAGPAG